mmetsp:Transcript_36791/g.115609  ORF Transcript_36791/g.115609 Transcript_36791/m.115609 type:complete len:221 (+) Transcript_36791:254-916(+)
MVSMLAAGGETACSAVHLKNVVVAVLVDRRGRGRQNRRRERKKWHALSRARAQHRVPGGQLGLLGRAARRFLITQELLEEEGVLQREVEGGHRRVLGEEGLERRLRPAPPRNVARLAKPLQPRALRESLSLEVGYFAPELVGAAAAAADALRQAREEVPLSLQKRACRGLSLVAEPLPPLTRRARIVKSGAVRLLVEPIRHLPDRGGRPPLELARARTVP